MQPRTRLIGIGAAVLFIALVYEPFLFRLTGFGNLIDADYNLAWQLAVNDAFRHGEILHWNPHVCGGVPGLATPDTRAMSPFILLALAPKLTTVLQVKIEVLVYLVLNALGFLLLCRRMGVSGLYGLIGFFISAGNGFIAFRILHGQTIFHPYLLVPLLFAFAWPCARPWPGGRPGWWPSFLPDPLPMFGGIAVVTLILLEDGVYVFLHTFMLVGGFVAIVAVRERRIRDAVGVVLWAVVPVLLCLPRILPAAELLAAHPRIVESNDFMTPAMMLMAFFHPDQVGLYTGWVLEPPHNVWGAYGAYIGVVPVVLAAFAFRKPRTSAVWALAIGVVVALVFMAGAFAPWAPWMWLRKLPGFTQFRAPYRFSWIAINCIAILAVIGTARVHTILTDKISKSSLRIAVLAAVAGAVAVPLGLALNPVFRRHIRPYQAPQYRIYREVPFLQHNFNPFEQLTHTALHRGVVKCWTGLDLPNAVKPGPPVSISDPTSGAILTTKPNRLIVHVSASAPSRVTIQQNYHRDWRAVTPAGAEVENAGGLLSVQLPAGEQRLELRYHPRAFRRGLLLSAPVWIALIAVLLAWLIGVRRRSTPSPGDSA